MFDFCFAENGLQYFKDGKHVKTTKITDHTNDKKLGQMISWIQGYMSKIELPVKRGTFIEFRSGMLNVSPIGRNCSREERNEFERYDKKHGIREKMVAAMKEEFADFKFTYSIGGQISFDVFPEGWDKTFCLRYLAEEDFDEIHFFGDKTYEGGNDYEIYTHARTKGHDIKDQNPLTTLKLCSELFGIDAPDALTPPFDHSNDAVCSSPSNSAKVQESSSANKRVLALFDVDGTLTEPRKQVSPETKEFLRKLREKIAIGVVGGSDLVKQKEQLGDSPSMFDFCFAENGLQYFKDGKHVKTTKITDHTNDKKLGQMISWIQGYMSKIELPVKRGTFIEFRSGMLNVSPIGRNCSREERNEFERYDKKHGIREKMVAAMKEEFADFKFTYSIGGQISFDVFPEGWDKTFCLRYLAEEDFDEIHFFGDKTYEGGNDYEIYTHARTKGHDIKDQNPLTTLKLCSELFGIDAPDALTPPSAH